MLFPVFVLPITMLQYDDSYCSATIAPLSLFSLDAKPPLPPQSPLGLHTIRSPPSPPVVGSAVNIFRDTRRDINIEGLAGGEGVSHLAPAVGLPSGP